MKFFKAAGFKNSQKEGANKNQVNNFPVLTDYNPVLVSIYFGTTRNIFGDSKFLRQSYNGKISRIP